MSGDLLSIFNVAKRGINTQQKAISVTSHNISNANTEGYSRQRAQIETTRPFCTPSMNSYIGPGQMGTGSEVQSIIRVRDNFLDYQVRSETSTLGRYEARDKYLGEIENIYNEPSENGISNLIGKFYDSWQQLSKQAHSSNARTVVAQQSSALAKELNHTYNQLQKVKDNVHDEIKQMVFDTNNILSQVDQLNQQIISVKVAGQEPNDLMDKRDLLIDKLSKTMNVNVDKREFYSIDLRPEDIDGVPQGGEKLLVRKEPNYAISKFSYVSGVDIKDSTAVGAPAGSKDIKISYFKKGNSNESGKDITITGIPAGKEKEIAKIIDECRVLWSKDDGSAYADGKDIKFDDIKTGTDIDLKKLSENLGLFTPEKGELKGFMSVQQDVDKYMDQLNKLAKGIALSVNIVHSGQTAVGNPTTDKPQYDTDGKLKENADFMPFFVNGSVAKYNDEHSMTNIKDILKSEVDINAGNIAINSEILNNVMEIKTRINDDKFGKASENSKDGEKDGNRALAIAQLRDKVLKIQNIKDGMDRNTFITSITGNNVLIKDGVLGIETIQSDINGMKVDAYFKDIVDELGIQEQEAQRIVINQNTLLAGFQESRESVSGVSLDEEMASLIQYQHAYQANAKIISVVDELLDVVVNGLKR